MHARWFAALLVAAGTGQTAEVLRHDFRGGRFPPETFRYFNVGGKTGSLVRKLVIPEEAGVRITLPGHEEPIGMLGFECQTAVAGDFEATLSYEIVKSEKPTKGYGIGLSFWVVADNAPSDIATLGRRVVQKGDILGTDRQHYVDGKDVHDVKRWNTKDQRGKLRLARMGEEVVYSAAGDDGVFAELRRAAFPTAPLKAIRVTADTGGSLGEFEALITELVVRSKGPVAAAPPAGGGAAAVAAPTPERPAEKPAERRFPVGLLIGFLIIIAGMALVIVALVWSRRRREPPPARPATVRRKA